MTKRPHSALAAGLLCLLAAPLLSLAAPPDRPVQTSITIEGSLDDWAVVLTNSLNTTRDGDGSDPSCSFSMDLDCPIPDRHDDLATFAWTWDADAWYFLADLRASTGGDRWVFVYLDLDRNGRMANGEPVVVLRLRDDTGQLDLDLDVYEALNPIGGDSLTGPTGLADGHDMPGSLRGTPFPLARDVGMARRGTAVEAAVPWAALGLSPGTPFDFHVSTAKGNNLPADLRDNLGSSSGGAGTTAWMELSLWPAISTAAAPGGSVELEHVIRNDGNIPVLVSLSAVSSVGGDLTWLEDANRDGFPETLLAYDAGGDGLFTLPGDELYPGADTNGDALPDLGDLLPGEQAVVVIRRDYDANQTGLVEELLVRAWDPSAPELERTLTDQVRVGDVVLRSEEIRVATPGDVAWLPHWLDNTSSVDQSAGMSATSGLGWATSVHDDPNGDGLPFDALPLVDGDGDGRGDLLVPGSSARALLARVEIPQAANLGVVDDLWVRAWIDGLPAAFIADRTILVEPLRVRPHHLLAGDDARHGGPGGAVWFAHRLENARGRESRIGVAAASDLGWATELWSDPNGDGRPDDAVRLTDPVLTLAPNGGEQSLLVRVSIPAGASVGTLSRVVVTAVAEDAPSVTAQAQDDAVVALVRLYDGPDHVVNVSRSAPCSTIYALASGLPPASAGFRFTWREPSGTAHRIIDTATDSSGTVTDFLALGPDDPPGAWSVDVERWDGFAWTVQDSASVLVDGVLDIQPPVVREERLHLTGATLVAEALVRNDSFDREEAVDLSWVVLSPDGASYLDAGGFFAPYSGVEATRMETVRLAPLAERTVTLNVPSVAHGGEGVHSVEAWRDFGCGSGLVLVGSAAYTVLDDEDGDGLSYAEEIAAGTDPRDADSDDDGLLDGEDGLGDSDGDGFIDALDCDSDDDGLFDGLEAGRWSAPADTDPAAGCWMPDLWPSTTTDPDDPDSDGGGVPDGAEDANGNGRIDGGELDPGEASDDLAACGSATPPEVAELRVRRFGETAGRLEWTGLRDVDPCIRHAVLVSESLPVFSDLRTDLMGSSMVDDAPAILGGLRYYLVAGESPVTGRGETGAP